MSSTTFQRPSACFATHGLAASCVCVRARPLHRRICRMYSRVPRAHDLGSLGLGHIAGCLSRQAAPLRVLADGGEDACADLCLVVGEVR